jgi:hypothetical protein
MIVFTCSHPVRAPIAKTSHSRILLWPAHPALEERTGEAFRLEL